MSGRVPVSCRTRRRPSELCADRPWTAQLSLRKRMTMTAPPTASISGASSTLFWLLLAAFAPSAGLAQSVLPQVGCAEWHRAPALALQGTVQEGGLNGQFTLLLDTRDGRNTSSQDFGIFSTSAGFDGKVGWSRDRSGGSHDLNAEAAVAISTTESWILRRGWCDVRDVVAEPMPDETRCRRCCKRLAPHAEGRCPHHSPFRPPQRPVTSVGVSHVG